MHMYPYIHRCIARYAYVFLYHIHTIYIHVAGERGGLVRKPEIGPRQFRGRERGVVIVGSFVDVGFVGCILAELPAAFLHANPRHR